MPCGAYAAAELQLCRPAAYVCPAGRACYAGILFYLTAAELLYIRLRPFGPKDYTGQRPVGTLRGPGRVACGHSFRPGSLRGLRPIGLAGLNIGPAIIEVLIYLVFLR